MQVIYINIEPNQTYFKHMIEEENFYTLKKTCKPPECEFVKIQNYALTCCKAVPQVHSFFKI